MGVQRSHRVGAAVWAVGLSALVAGPAVSRATVLLNDTWADGNRSSTSLPTDSPVYIGQSAANGSNSVSAGHLNFVLPTNSLKVWTYFTSDQSAPDGNQPHNSVTTLGVGDSLTASATFSVTGLTTTTGKNFRMGLFFDPTDARVQADTNSDGGGGTSPWADAVGYAIQLPITALSNSSPFQIAKRTTSNTSLLGASGALTNASTGGSQYSMANDTSYTVKMTLTELSATDMQVDVVLLQGATVLASQTVHDLGTSFGGTAIGTGLLSGSQSIYTKFDQLFFRDSDNSQSSTLDFTNFHVEAVVPEPASAGILALAAATAVMPRRRHRA